MPSQPNRDLRKSNAHFKRAVKRLPLGVASTFRYWGDDRTIYVHHGKGGRTWDIDGNGYVDYRLGYGPAILGYADDRVDAAAMRGMQVGGVFALSTERELAVAERIAKMVPAAELVRFSNSGTEAVMSALRLARAYTGRESYLLVEGGYHGLFDAAMWHGGCRELAGRFECRPGGDSLRQRHSADREEVGSSDADERHAAAGGRVPQAR